MGTQPDDNVTLAPMLNTHDMARILKCSPRTVYRLADSGRIPSPTRFRTLVRWNATVVQAWLAAGCPASRGFRRGQNSRE